MEKIIISTTLAPSAIGPYSQAVRVGNLVFVSGQLGADPATGLLADGIVEQTRQSLANMQAVLTAVGLDAQHVVKTTVFLRDLDDFGVVNEEYSKVFREAHPARSCVEVSRLPKRALVEIECIAVYPEETE